MAIATECQDCGRLYRLPDEKAGKKIRCRDCGAVVDVPRGGRSGRSASRRAAAVEAPPKPRKANRPNRSKSRTSGANKPLIFAGIAAGVLICIAGGIFLGMKILGNDGPAGGSATSMLSGGATNGSGDAASLSEEEKAQKQAAYEANLNAQRRARGQDGRASLASRYGAGKVVTVVISGVVGETEAANKYLQRKLFRAAYKEYEASRRQAANQTESNRKAAESRAVQDHKDTWGDFGPAFVQYRYELVDSDVPYPRIINAGRDGDTFVFHAAPASSPQEFARRLGIGPVGQASGREVRVQAQLPTPIPDPDVEELALQYGLDQVVQVNVSDAEGDPKLVQLYLENETVGLGSDGKRLSLVAMKALGNGQYQFHAAPVRNAQVFAERIPWGSVQNVDANQQSIQMAASLPENLPTEADLKAAKAAERAREKAIRDADWARKPRPDESELDWAIRVIKDKETFAIEKALKALAIMDVVEDRREEVSKLLILSMGESQFGVKHLLPAMMRWKTDQTEKALLRLGGERLATWDRPVVMEALAEIGTPATAEALASALPDFFSGEESVRYLIEAGPVAEEPVLKYLKHKDAKVRARVYTVLMEIGGREASSKLRTNVKLENDPAMKAHAEAALEEVRARLKSEREAASADSDKSTNETENDRN